ncbi:putative uncharacterized protein DDB_G0271606 [Cyclospora cayetanensis]|uniref:Uncharacterized protein n=1 Tax=Cyclospora cayetanensis TaxID=88456 RepID=A0A6P6RZA6_9EIME|nr:putative uncharacterized protein DDB_G0271606 [Cyclospora cayetanensis]
MVLVRSPKRPVPSSGSNSSEPQQQHPSKIPAASPLLRPGTASAAAETTAAASAARGYTAAASKQKQQPVQHRKQQQQQAQVSSAGAPAGTQNAHAESLRQEEPMKRLSTHDELLQPLQPQQQQLSQHHPEEDVIHGIPRSAAAFQQQWHRRLQQLEQQLGCMDIEQQQLQQAAQLEARSHVAIRQAAHVLRQRQEQEQQQLQQLRHEQQEAQQQHEASESRFVSVQTEAAAAAGGDELLQRRLQQTHVKKQQLQQLQQQKHALLLCLSKTECKARQLQELLLQLKQQQEYDVNTLREEELLLSLATRFKFTRINGTSITGLTVPDQRPPAAAAASVFAGKADAAASPFEAAANSSSSGTASDLVGEQAEGAAIVQLELPSLEQQQEKGFAAAPPAAPCEAADVLWQQLMQQAHAEDSRAAFVLQRIREVCSS